MRTAISIALFALTVICSIAIGGYLATLREPDAGMGLLGVQVIVLGISALTLAAGAAVSLLYRSEPLRSAIAALLVGGAGFAVLAISQAF